QGVEVKTERVQFSKKRFDKQMSEAFAFVRSQAGLHQMEVLRERFRARVRLAVSRLRQRHAEAVDHAGGELAVGFIGPVGSVVFQHLLVLIEPRLQVFRYRDSFSGWT